MDDWNYCIKTLPKVSRTFALNIAVLKGSLHRSILIAYLFCRTIDTVEDACNLEAPTKTNLLLDFASILKNISGWDGSIEHGHTFPDGTPRKVMDVSKINNLGWNAKINLEKGLRDTYDWYANNFSSSKVKKN